MSEFEVIKESFEVTNKIGNVIRGVIYRPDAENRTFPTVIFSHGFGSNYRLLESHGPRYAANGIACILYDFCGGGMESTSDGSMLEMTVITEVEDLKTVMDKVVSLSFVNKDELFLHGESQGGFVSTMVGVERKSEVKGLILWYPAFVIPDDSKKRFEENVTNVFGIEISPDYDRVAKDIVVSEVQSKYDKPVIIIHGDADPVVPVSYAYDAEKNFPDAELIVLPGAGHGFNEVDSETAIERSIAFVKK